MIEMTEQTAWFAAIAAVLIAALIGFFIGRSCGGGKERIRELEAEVEQQNSEVQRQAQEIEGYRKEVETHFDKTATLFVSMAGSYKELFEHLSSGYEKLSSGSARTLFQQRVDALLVGSARDAGEADKLLAGVGAAAAMATVADAAAVEAAGADESGVDTLSTTAPGADASETETPSDAAPDAAGTQDAMAATEEAIATQADALAESAEAVASDHAPAEAVRDLAAEAYRNEGAQADDPLSEALSGEGAAGSRRDGAG